MSYKSKSASVSYEPGKTSVRKLIEAVRGTVKYGATLEAPVITTLEAHSGKWTAYAEPPACAPGTSGGLVLRFVPANVADAGDIAVHWSSDAELQIEAGAPKRNPKSGEWTTNAAFKVPADVDRDEFLVRVVITRPAVGTPSTELVVVVPVAASR